MPKQSSGLCICLTSPLLQLATPAPVISIIAVIMLALTLLLGILLPAQQLQFFTDRRAVEVTQAE